MRKTRFSEETMQMLKETYKPGYIVELIHMDDEAAPPAGTRGTIMLVDAIGTISVLWRGYGFLGLIYGVDEFKIVEEKEDGS